MTFVVVFIVCVVAVHGAQQFGAQVDGNLRLCVVIFILLFIYHVDIDHVCGVAGWHN